MILPSIATDYNTVEQRIQKVIDPVLAPVSLQKSLAQSIRKNIEEIDEQIEETKKDLDRLMQKTSRLKPLELQSFEKESYRLTRKINDLISAKALQLTTASSDVKKEGRLLTKKGKSCVDKGLRRVNITFACGTVIAIYTTYYSRKGSAGRRGKGYYPELVLLGVYDFLASSLVSEIMSSAVTLGSCQEAIDMLSARGVKIGSKRMMKLARKFVASARLGQDRVTQTLFEEELKGNRIGSKLLCVSPLKRPKETRGKRIVVSVDGGRVRVRTVKRGPKTKKNRNHYHTDWKEPKLLIIYIVDEDGRRDKHFHPIIDGQISGPDPIFELLYQYLSPMNLQKADKLLFIADGATWIWDRVKPLQQRLEKAGIHCSFFELIDFFHAAQHLYDFSKCKIKWSGKQRSRWVNKQKKKLKEGCISEVLQEMKQALKGSRKKGIRKEYNYFFKNQHRMNYRLVSQMGLPIGSGAIESAIRRIVNLRMKSPCIFWCKESANAMIMLRSYFKAGRWKALTQAVYYGELMKLAA